MRDYLHLFKGSQETILAAHSAGGLKEPYIYNSLFIEEDPFMRGEEQEERKEPAGGITQEQLLTIEGMKIQLKSIYTEIVHDYD